MLLDRLGASLLANMLGKEVVRDGGVGGVLTWVACYCYCYY